MESFISALHSQHLGPSEPILSVLSSSHSSNAKSSSVRPRLMTATVAPACCKVVAVSASPALASASFTTAHTHARNAKKIKAIRGARHEI
eukprot:m.71693 g.71693  ORF g.71693 m.71693 type:complete len:90 (-) comp50199_c0_seq2:489-758(-)